MQRPDERGQTLVEFALVIPIVLLLMLGLFDLGRIVFLNNSLSDGARHGARHATTDVRDANYCTNVDTAVRSSIRGMQLTTYTVTLDAVADDGTVTATYVICSDGANGPGKAAMAANPTVGPGDRVRIDLGTSVDLALGFIAQAAGQQTFDLAAESTMQVTFAPK